jgi:hypothetical protein
MAEIDEADVAEVVYVGPHSIQPGIHLVTVKIVPAQGARGRCITLRLRPAEAAQLAHMLQANPPPPAADHLLQDVAAHET